MQSQDLAMNYWYWAMGCGVAAIILPWLALPFNRWAAAAVAGVLSLASTVLESYSNSSMPSSVNIRVDIVFIAPVLLLAWVHCLNFVVSAAFQKRAKAPDA